jgi:hypothetical protein
MDRVHTYPITKDAKKRELSIMQINARTTKAQVYNIKK